MSPAWKTSKTRQVVRVALPVGLLAVAWGLQSAIRSLDAYHRSPYPIARALRFDASVAGSRLWVARADRGLADEVLPVEFEFRPGETLSDALQGFGLDPVQVHAVVGKMAEHCDVRRLRTEDRYAVLVDPRGEPRGFRLTLAGKGRVDVYRESDGWQSAWRPFVKDARIQLVKGSLDGLLEASIQRAGAEPVLAYVMAEVLQWDLDFNRDLRLGDRFEVLYETVFLDGQFHRVGQILALTYENRGRILEAYRFGEDGGYYDAEGRALRKLFLRSPLRFSRITSGFSGRRFHPVLKQFRPHYGVDYGAPVGTPVRVTASGVVRFAGWEKGGGRVVKVSHPNGYLTAYLHLSRFAIGVRPGRRVVQGEVIGYVGSTGLATAPHLDYRMQRDGRWINPMTLKMQPSEPIPDERLPEFVARRDRLRAALRGEQILAPEVASTGQQAAALAGAEKPASEVTLGP